MDNNNATKILGPVSLYPRMDSDARTEKIPRRYAMRIEASVSDVQVIQIALKIVRGVKVLLLVAISARMNAPLVDNLLVPIRYTGVLTKIVIATNVQKIPIVRSPRVNSVARNLIVERDSVSLLIRKPHVHLDKNVSNRLVHVWPPGRQLWVLSLLDSTMESLKTPENARKISIVSPSPSGNINGVRGVFLAVTTLVGNVYNLLPPNAEVHLLHVTQYWMHV